MTEIITHFGSYVADDLYAYTRKPTVIGRNIYVAGLNRLVKINYDTNTLSFIPSTYPFMSSLRGPDGALWMSGNNRVTRMSVDFNEFTTYVYSVINERIQYAVLAGTTIYFPPSYGDRYKKIVLGGTFELASSSDRYVTSRGVQNPILGQDGMIYSMPNGSSTDGDIQIGIEKYDPATGIFSDVPGYEVSTSTPTALPFAHGQYVYWCGYGVTVRVNTLTQITDYINFSCIGRNPGWSGIFSVVVRGDYAYAVSRRVTTYDEHGNIIPNDGLGDFVLKINLIDYNVEVIGRAGTNSYYPGALANNGSIYFPGTTDILKIGFGKPGGTGAKGTKDSPDNTKGSNPTDYGGETKDPENPEFVPASGHVYVYNVHYEVSDD